MVIRCERCSTLYELDEALLSPAGSQVQCTRCQHVFTAFPPRSAGRTLVGMPAQAPEPSPAAGQARAAAPRASPAAAQAAPPRAAAGARPEPSRAVRTGPPPVYRPSGAPAPATAGRAPLLRRDTVGTFENRLRWSARLRWLAPLVVVLVAVAGIAGWWALSRRGDPTASRARGDAMALVALDDTASVEQAVSRLDGILRHAPKAHGAAADRALAHVLWAASLVEEGESLAARHAARAAERDRLRKEQPDGWEDAERAAAADAQRIGLEVRGREERARSFGGAAFQALRRLQADLGDAPEVARGLAAYYALGGERDRARKTIREARQRAPADPWLALAEGWVDSRDPDHAGRERALVELRALSAAHPELLRARYLLARTQAVLGRRGEALATLDGLIAANGRHEAGKRLRDELSAPVRAPAPAPAREEPPPANPPTQTRKRVAHPPAAPAPAAAPAPPSEAAAGLTEPQASPLEQPGGAPLGAAASPPAGAAEPAPAPPVTPPGAGEPTAPRPPPPAVHPQSPFLDGG